MDGLEYWCVIDASRCVLKEVGANGFTCSFTNVVSKAALFTSKDNAERQIRNLTHHSGLKAVKHSSL